MVDTKALADILQDRKKYCEKFLRIKTKAREIVGLNFNVVQVRIADMIKKLEKEKRPIRLIILKARQEGCSTLIEAFLFHDTVTNANTNSIIIADDAEKAEYLFQISKMYYDMLPQFIKPMVKYSSKKELLFENKSADERGENPGLRSRISVDTAGNAEIGRAMTVNNVHCSEVAFWGANAGYIMGGLLQSVPTNQGMVILESTGNMVGGYFHDEYFKAKDGESNFTAMFFPWFIFPEYKTKATRKEIAEIKRTLTEREEYLKKKFDLNYAQLKWRRNKIKDFSKEGEHEPEDLFRREYPSEDIDAFLSSGRPVFRSRTLQSWKTKLAKSEYKRGDLIKTDEGEIIFVENEKGNLRVWEDPEPDERYVLGVDVSEGLPKGDFACIQVVGCKGFKQVAEWHGKKDPDELARDVELLAIWYNEGLVAVEANNHGLTTLNVLKKNYYNIFFRQVLDENTNEWQDKIGWLTTSKTRPMLVDGLIQIVREREFEFTSVGLIDEMLVWVRDDRGIPTTQSNRHDDRIMALGIAVQLYTLVPYEEEAPKAPGGEDVDDPQYQNTSWEEL